MFIEEVNNKMLPFWKNMIDERGGFYGHADSSGLIDRDAVKGGVYHSRILWFFSNAYRITGDGTLKKYYEHAYKYIKEYFIDYKNTGMFWSLNHNGTVHDGTKHTYNNAFLIYGLISYYNVSKDAEALKLATEIFECIETKAKNPQGYYQEQFDDKFCPTVNSKLSGDGLNAVYTMNTMLHIIEAYTDLYTAGKNAAVGKALTELLHLTESKAYNPDKKRLEVFFDENMNSIADIHSYGHDIEAAWLFDKALNVLGGEVKNKLSAVTESLSETVLTQAFDGEAVNYESVCFKVNTDRIWWVQAEAVVGFINAYQKTGKTDFLDAAAKTWKYIHNNLINTEWYWLRTKDGKIPKLPFAEMWKCPYHNGRMYFELEERNVRF